MIPKRYDGIKHGLKLIYWEEGVKGLYRGFMANMTSVNFIILSLLF